MNHSKQAPKAVSTLMVSHGGHFWLILKHAPLLTADRPHGEAHIHTQLPLQLVLLSWRFASYRQAVELGGG